MGFERTAHTGELKFDAVAKRARVPEDQVYFSFSIQITVCCL